MKLHPRSMSLYQLKQAIVYNQGRLDHFQSDQRKFNIDSKDWKRLQVSVINYKSAVRVCEFTLQRKIDELNSRPRAEYFTNQERKQLVTILRDRLLVNKFQPEFFDKYVKELRNFIQNYNEL